MTEHDAPRLPPPFETLLCGWPVPDRSEDEWEASTRAILDRVVSGEVSGEVNPTDEVLLEAPKTEGDPAALDRKSSPGRDGPTLAEIARANVRNDDRERQLAVAQESLKHIKLARHTGEAALTVARAAEVADLQRHREERQSANPEPRGAGVRGAMIGAALAFLAAAASFVIYVSVERPTVEPPTPSSVAAGHEGDRRYPASEEGDEPLARLDELPVDEADRTDPKGARRPSVPRPGKPLAAGRQETAVLPSSSAKVELDEFDAPIGRPAHRDGSETRLAPTVGEAQAAVASSLPRAKICVAGHSAPSSATVTFSSNGRVRGVVVSGPAAGTPAAECIKNAFMAARVDQFANPEFTVRVSVRP